MARSNTCLKGSPVADVVPQPPRPPLVDREREMALLHTALDAAMVGAGRLFLVSGEAGIGKTRLLEETAAAATNRGAVVAWGRCWKEAEAAPLWPWLQVLRTLGWSGEEAQGGIGVQPAGVAQITRLGPRAAHETTHGASAASAPERFEVLDRITAFLHATARRRPLVLLLDDLQAAADASLALLELLGQGLAATPLLVVATFRECELHACGSLSHRLGALARGSTAIPLCGLDERATRELIRTIGGCEPSTAVVKAIHDATGGNPFYVDEMARALAAEGRLDDDRIGAERPLAIPDRVRSAVRERVALFPEAACTSLEAAATIGREFDTDLVATVVGETPEEVMAALSVCADLVRPHGPRGSRFVHGLVREIIYEGISPSARGDLHARIVRALEARHPAQGNAVLSLLAHHARHAQRAIEPARVLSYTRRAGERALGLLAYEEASRHFEQALALCDRIEAPGEGERAELLLALARATTRAGDPARAQEAATEAAAQARRLGSPTLLAEAGLVCDPGDGVVPDPARISLLEDALAALPPQQSSVRARVLARLAWELSGTPQSARRNALGEEALEAARGLRDPAALGYALAMRCLVLADQEDGDARLPVATELLELAHRTGDPELAVEAHEWRLTHFLGDGDAVALDRESRTATRLAERLAQPRYLWRGALWRAMRATLIGRFADARHTADAALAVGIRIRPSEAGMCFAWQSMARAWLEGTLGDFAEATDGDGSIARGLVPTPGAWRAWVLAAAGRLDDARRELETFTAQEIQSEPRDGRAATLGALAEACARVGCEHTARSLRSALQPWSGRIIVAGPAAACFGPADRFLGILAAVSGDWQAAENHFATALTLSRRLASSPLVAKTLQSWASMLDARGSSDDGGPAERMRREARELAEGLGMRGFAEQARRPAPRPLATSLRADDRLTREGEYWTFARDGKVSRVRHRSGMTYLAKLLEHPHQQLPALVLAAAVTPSRPDAGRVDGELWIASPLDLGVMLDERARAEYSTRLEELDSELEDAERLNDLGRMERLRHEQEILRESLSKALGIGGRPRRAGSPAERARVRVTRGLRDIIERVHALDSALGAHLRDSVRTGTCCVYAPRDRAQWTVCR